MSVAPDQRFTSSRPCPVCGGHAQLLRGNKERCYGFLSGDGSWAHCTREEHAGGLEQNPESGTYGHRLMGNCRCGSRHNPSPASDNGHAPGRAKEIVKTYDYRDADGKLLSQAVRYNPKDFKQRRPSGNGRWIWNLKGVERVLYRLPELLAADSSETVFVAEGEKDADRLAAFDFVATTNSEGAGNWREEFTPVLNKRHVAILQDNDEAGQKHVETVARMLHGEAASVKVVALPSLPEKGGDVSDWFDNGGTPEELVRLVQEAPVWQPKSAETHSDHPIGSGFGQNELLPLKTPRDVVNAAKDSTDWIVEGLLAPGEITDLAGTAKLSGKTTFVTHMLASVVRGEKFMGFATRKAKVLYLTEQGNNFANALKKSSLVEAGEALRIVQYRDLDSKTRCWDNLIKTATESCKRNGFQVLVVDTFAGLSGLRGTEENNVGDILEKMAPLKDAAQKHGLAVVVARHAGKDGKGRGSSIFEGEADIILTLGRPQGNHKETARVLEGIGRHDDIPSRTTIELTNDGYVSFGNDDKIEFLRAVEAIRAITPHDLTRALTEKEILDASAAQGCSRTTLKRALESLTTQTENSVKQEGEGKKGNPYRYWQPSSKEPPD